MGNKKENKKDEQAIDKKEIPASHLEPQAESKEPLRPKAIDPKHLKPQE